MLKINRKNLRQFDWYIFGILLAISLIGVITVYSATRPILSTLQPNYYIKQLIWMCVGLPVLLLVVIYDYYWLKKFAYVFYLIGLILLAMVLVIGKKGMGAQRWIDLGFFAFQPSELFRIFLVIALARYLSAFKDNLSKGAFTIGFFLFGVLPFLLIIKQPHLGTGLIIMALFFSMALAKGVEKNFLITVVIVTLVIFPLAGKTLWKHLKDYQKNRIVAFLDPNVDPKGIGYQIEQSKITIGSGMVFGRGYLHGTQGPLKFLPEKHTDFIFSVFAEEWGFVGCVIVFALYLLLFMRGIDTAVKSKDDFGTFCALGITFMLFMYFVINIGMVLGMMPVVGVPIPFMSYGGTSIVSNYLAVGILINIRMRRLGLFYK